MDISAATDLQVERAKIPVSERPVGLWLLVVALLVFAMVVLGGATRLTDSGLSIVEWKPVTGVLPPLSEAAWQAEFDQYRLFPEYQKINRGMSLAEFKSIYWFEYSHRMLGRAVGLAFLLPFVWFVLRGRLQRRRVPVLAGLFLLGGLQGLLGWWMVKSGLVDRPDVSHYRLTAHLGLAVLLFGALLWLALDMLLPAPRHPSRASRGWRLAGAGALALVYLQVLSGGLVAGLDAGLAYNTFPLMNGMLFPPELLQQSPWWLNLVENPTTVQFDHRVGAFAVAAALLALWWRGERGGLAASSLLGLRLAAAALVVQVALGVLTLLHVVPLTLGVLHQAGALVLFGTLIFACQRLWRETGMPLPTPASATDAG